MVSDDFPLTLLLSEKSEDETTPAAGCPPDVARLVRFRGLMNP
jgi:hypothetical protein